MDRIWVKNYPAGVPAEIDAAQYPSLVALFEESFAKYKNANAYACMDKKLTYGQLDEMSRALGAWLQSKGLQRGDRVAIMMPNVLQYPVCVAGILRAGYVVVNVNPLYTPRELEHQLKDSGAKAIVIIENFAKTLEQVLRQDARAAHRAGEHGRSAGLPQGHDRQHGGAQGEEDGAGLLAAGRRQVQRRDRGRPAPAADQARHQARRRRLPAVHRRHHRRVEGRHAAAPQRHRQRAAERGLAAARAQEGQAGGAA